MSSPATYDHKLNLIPYKSEPEPAYLEWSGQGTDYNLCAIASASWYAKHANAMESGVLQENLNNTEIPLN